jgi:RNA polymerase sigma factor (sigma-70 family)
MSDEHTTSVVQRYLNALGAEDVTQERVVRELLGHAIGRLQMLCASFLHRSYPRLRQAPLNLQPDELLSAVAERLLKAMRVVRPQTARQFFALASQHIRWELNDLARRLDERQRDVGLPDALAAPDSSDSSLTPNARRMLEAIDSLPEEEREVFSLVRIQGLTHPEVAELVRISLKTVQRRLNRALVLLTQRLDHPSPP